MNSESETLIGLPIQQPHAGVEPHEIATERATTGTNSPRIGTGLLPDWLRTSKQAPQPLHFRKGGVGTGGFRSGLSGRAVLVRVSRRVSSRLRACGHPLGAVTSSTFRVLFISYSTGLFSSFFVRVYSLVCRVNWVGSTSSSVGHRMSTLGTHTILDAQSASHRGRIQAGTPSQLFHFFT